MKQRKMKVLNTLGGWRKGFLIQGIFTSQSSKSMMWKTMQSGNLAVKRVRNHWDAYI